MTTLVREKWVETGRLELKKRRWSGKKRDDMNGRDVREGRR